MPRDIADNIYKEIIYLVKKNVPPEKITYYMNRIFKKNYQVKTITDYISKRNNSLRWDEAKAKYSGNQYSMFDENQESNDTIADIESDAIIERKFRKVALKGFFNPKGSPPVVNNRASYDNTSSLLSEKVEAACLSLKSDMNKLHTYIKGLEQNVNTLSNSISDRKSINIMYNGPEDDEDDAIVNSIIRNKLKNSLKRIDKLEDRELLSLCTHVIISMFLSSNRSQINKK